MIVITDSRERSDIFIADLLKEIDPRAEGEIAYALIEQLYPICRSITGNGVRRSLGLLRETIPLALREVTSDTQVFDWTVPDEWNIRDASNFLFTEDISCSDRALLSPGYLYLSSLWES